MPDPHDPTGHDGHSDRASRSGDPDRRARRDHSDRVDPLERFDHRLALAVVGALGALAAGVAAVVTGEATLGIVAGGAGLATGTAAAALAARLRHSEERLTSASHDIQRLHHELDTLSAIISEESNRRNLGDDAGEGLDPTRRPEHAFDPATGLYDEKYFAVLVQQQVAAARRSLRPISVVIFEIDRMQDAAGETREQALGVVGDVVRRTLRESDSACRLGEVMIGSILEDTAEAGAVWAAERVRGTLLASPVGDSLTVSAGVACYPTHALGAAELVGQAGRALEEARARGRDRVELAPDA